MRAAWMKAAFVDPFPPQPQLRTRGCGRPPTRVPAPAKTLAVSAPP